MRTNIGIPIDVQGISFTARAIKAGVIALVLVLEFELSLEKEHLIFTAGVARSLNDLSNNHPFCYVSFSVDENLEVTNEQVCDSGEFSGKLLHQMIAYT